MPDPRDSRRRRRAVTVTSATAFMRQGIAFYNAADPIRRHSFKAQGVPGSIRTESSLSFRRPLNSGNSKTLQLCGVLTSGLKSYSRRLG
ncbi:MAG: hypothetical protein Tsb009_30860 [Planctomycetaceae bacterium]